MGIDKALIRMALVVALALPGTALAQRSVMTAGDQTINGTKTFTDLVIDPTGTFQLDDRTVASLPTCNSTEKGNVYIVNDGSSSTDCTSGGGSNVNMCLCNGSSHVVVSGSGSGITQIQAASDTLFSGGLVAGQLIIWDGASFWKNKTVSGDATLNSLGALTISTNAIEESMLKAVDSATDEECLTYESTTGDFEWQSCDPGTGGWTDGGTEVSLGTTTDNVYIGAAQINSSKFSVDGDADVVQVSVQAHSTQTDSVVIVENSGGTEVVNIEADGTILTAVGLDAIGAVDMDYGSADVTDHTFLTDGTGTAEVVLPDGSIDSTEILDNTIVDADINSSAAIGITKLDPNVADVTGDSYTGAHIFVDGITFGNNVDEDLQLTFDLLAADQTFKWDDTLGEFVFSAGLSVGGTGSSLEFEGATADANETTLTVTDPTSDNTVTIPDASGTVAMASGAVTSGVVLWGDIGDASFDTGTEVCAAVGLTCHGAVEMDGTEITNCSTTATGTASGWFVALCY